MPDSVQRWPNVGPEKVATFVLQMYCIPNHGWHVRDTNLPLSMRVRDWSREGRGVVITICIGLPAAHHSFR